jgi:hypothetical protein
MSWGILFGALILIIAGSCVSLWMTLNEQRRQKK